MTFSQSTLESIFAIWAAARFHFGPLAVGMTLFVLAIVAVATQGGLVRKLAPRFGEHRLAIAGIVAVVLGLATVALAGRLGLVIVGFVLCGFGAGLFNPAAPRSPRIRPRRTTVVRSWGCISPAPRPRA